ncbi:YjbH domain-containing protein [Gammaproteobacteria bacterium]|nr:YjbH domain-containing protein [Gammaproteobacteria bacterium]
MNFKVYFIFIFSVSISAGIDDYIYPKSQYPSFSNSGTIGLIQMPSARMMPSGSVAFSWSDSDPYLRGSLIATPFSWGEASYQYTDVNNALYSLTPEFSGDQTYKDKSFDAKFLIHKETNMLPAIAVGFRDLAGTGVFSSEYFVASKKINNIDLTMGLGWGSYSDHGFRNPLIDLDSQFELRDVGDNVTQGGEFSTGYWFSGKVGIFAGAEIFLPNLNGLRFKIEYDSTDYEFEGFPYGKESFNFAFENVRQPTSKINFGFVYPVNDMLHLKLNYIKGHTLSFGFSMHGNFGKKQPLIKKNDPPKPVRDADIYKIVTAESDLQLYKASLLHLNPRGMPLQNATVEGDKYKVVFSQSKHMSWPRVTGRTLRVLDQISPEKVKKFEVANLNGGLGMYKLTIDREAFSKYEQDKMYKLAVKNAELESYTYLPEEYEFRPKVKLPDLFWRIVPTVKQQLGGPDGFFFGNIRLSLKGELALQKNLSVKFEFSQGLIDNFDSLKLASDSVLPHVRTDVVKYLKEGRKNLIVNYLQIDRFFKPMEDIYAKATFGLVENMFGAIGGEFLYRPFSENYALGAELWQVKQRDYDQMFSFRDYETKTGHINLYYKEPRSNVLVALKGGRFLAGDSGINFDFSRRFKSGLKMGIFFSLTDISEYEFGEGSFDKGFYFFIPIESFFDKYSKGSAGIGLKPLTRDGAAMLRHTHNLYGVTEQGQYMNIARDWDDLYD